MTNLRPAISITGLKQAAANLYLPVMAVVALLLLASALRDVAAVLAGEPDYTGSDVTLGYLPAARRFLETGSPYLPAQLAGSVPLEKHTFIHPPAALPLFGSFLVLPLVLWRILPLAFTAYVIWSFRPAPWTWPLMALCVAWPRSTGAILAGNSDMWVMAIVAAALRWHWPVALLAIKPSCVLLGVIGARHRSAGSQRSWPSCSWC